MRLRKFLDDLYEEFPGVRADDENTDVNDGDLVDWLCNRAAVEERRELELPNKSSVLESLAEIGREGEQTGDDTLRLTAVVLQVLISAGALCHKQVFVGHDELVRKARNAFDDLELEAALATLVEEGVLRAGVFRGPTNLHLYRIGEKGQDLVATMLRDHAAAKAVRA